MPTILLENFKLGSKSLRFGLGTEPNLIVNLNVDNGMATPYRSSPILASSGMSSYSPSGTIQTIKLVKDASASRVSNYVFAKAGTVVWMASVTGNLTTGAVLNWMPLVATSTIDTSGAFGIHTSNYTNERESTGPESIIQYGGEQWGGSTFSNVFIGANEAGTGDALYKWAGYTYNTGTVMCTGGSVTGSTFVASGVNFISGGVYPGDILYVYNSSAQKWRCTSGHPGYVIANVNASTLEVFCTSGHIETTTGRGAASGNYCSYVIQRVYPLGLNMPGSSGQIVNMYDTMYKGISVTGGASGTPYYETTCSYVYRYGDSRTGTWTNYSNAASNLVSGRINTVSGWVTSPEDPRLNTLQIFRAPIDVATSGVGVYTYLGSYTRNQDTSTSKSLIPFGSGYVDETVKLTTTADNILTGYDAAHDKPYYNGVRGLYLHAGRLMGTQLAWGDFNKRQLSMSHLVSLSNNYSQWRGLEYWNYRTTSVDTGNTLDVGGGWLGVGNGAEVITGLRSEGNSFNQTGLTNGALLIFTNQHLYRLQGSTWSTFVLNTVSKIDGPTAFAHTASVNGNTYWLSKSGLWGLAAGSSTPEKLSDRIFPQGLSSQDISSWQLSVVGDNLLLSGLLIGSQGLALGINGTFSMLYSNGIFTILNQALTSADYVNLPGSNINSLAVDSSNTIYAFMSADSAVPCKYRSLPLSFDAEPSLLTKGHYLSEVALEAIPDTSDITVTLNVYEHASSGAVVSTSGTITGSSYVGASRIIKLRIDETFIRPVIELTWTGTSSMSLNWLSVEYRNQGSSELIG